MQEIRQLCWLIGFLCVCVCVCKRAHFRAYVSIYECVYVWETAALIIWVKASVYYASVIHCKSFSDPCWYPSGFLSPSKKERRQKIDGWSEKECEGESWERGERQREKERASEWNSFCVCVYSVCVCLRGPYGFSAGSRLIICIFSFELLFAALRAAQTPKGPAE